MTSPLPLIFVVSVTAVKQGYEDYLRHKNDKSVNRMPVDVVLNGRLQVRLSALLKPICTKFICVFFEFLFFYGVLWSFSCQFLSWVSRGRN